jgi:hypothetical protein
MNPINNIETSIKNKPTDSSLKSEKWVDVQTRHKWLAKILDILKILPYTYFTEISKY